MDVEAIRRELLARFENEEQSEVRIATQGWASQDHAEVAAWAREQGFLVHPVPGELVVRRVSRFGKSVRPPSLQAIDRRRKMW